MNHALTVSPSHRASQETYKALVLTVGDRLLALPVNFILKIINAPPELSDDLNAMGLIYLKDRVLTVLDLYAQLGVSAGRAGDRKFLIVMQMSQGELCAIPLRELPSMMDIPVSEVRPLPETFSGLRLVGLASHVALLPQEGKPLEIFLLNMRKLAEMMHVASLPPGR